MMDTPLRPPDPLVYHKLVPSKTTGNSADVDYSLGCEQRFQAPKQGSQPETAVLRNATDSCVSGLKTVGDLMARIAQAAMWNCMPIADEKRNKDDYLMIIGTGQSAPAADLLQAVAFCRQNTISQPSVCADG